MRKVPGMLAWSGFVLIFIIGLIHVIDAPDSFSDAAYKGWLFYANGIAALFSAAGILFRKSWAWNLGMGIATASFLGYVASRTVGLPMIPAEPEAWFEPLGVASLIAEALFVAVYLNSLYKTKS